MLKSCKLLLVRNSSCLFDIDVRKSFDWNEPCQEQLMPKRKHAKSRPASGTKFVKLSPYVPQVSARKMSMSQSKVKVLPSPVKSVR